MKKLITIFTIILIIAVIIPITCFAVDVEDPLGSGDFKKSDDMDTEVVTKPLNIILSVIQVIGISVATIMLIALGIKYMVSSAADRAEIKKHAITYVFGALIMFGSAGLVEIIKDFGTNLQA